MHRILGAALAVCALASASYTQDQVAPVTEPAATSAGSQQLELTIEELAAYNGTEGKPMYVAVDGVIYDVTGVKAWKKGKHKGGAAGTDITERIKKAPHKAKVLKKRKVVGRIVEKTGQ